MKITAVVVVLLISMLVIQNVESWRTRRLLRRIRRILKPICKRVCPRVCTRVIKGGKAGKYVCKFACKRICRGKRDVNEIENGHITPLPAYMQFYDIDESGKVSIEEFADTLGHFDFESDLILAFNMTDTDKDGLLSEEELLFSEQLQFSTIDGVKDD